MLGWKETYTAPSDRVLTQWDCELWCELEDNGSFGWNEEEITFNQGFKSHIYVRGRNDLSDNPWLLCKVAGAFSSLVDQLPYTHGKQKCLIGVPTAGTQLAQEIARKTLGRLDITPHCFRTMRTELKTHGKDNMWIGPADLSKHTYVTVENVCSTASSMIQAFERMEPEGYPVREMHHVILADWELGGVKNLAAAGIHNAHICYIVRDIVALFVHIGRWPQERWDYIEPKLAAFR